MTRRSFAIIPALLAVGAVSLWGQAPAPTPPRASAPIDLTGYWVSIVTEDWRWRMVTPAKGDYASIPLTAEAKRVADTWDPAKDEASGEQCRSYGAPGLMRIPGRLHITWQDDNTLKMEIDTGTQTRTFHFGTAQAPAGDPDWQGFSLASWELPGNAGGGGAGFGRRGGGAAPTGPRPGASMKVVTTRMRPGYWQKNGVPYSANARMTEWFTTLSEPTGDTYLLVTKLLEDPQYIQGGYYRTVQFKKQNDATGWNPTPCSAR
jgi:hypothetical protein